MQQTERVVELFRDYCLTHAINADFALDTALGESGVGLSSLKIIEFMNVLEDELGVEIPERYWDTRQVDTLGSLIGIVAKC